MSVWNAIGIGVLIVLLRLLAPAVLTQGESTAVSFLKGAEVSANVASSYAASSAALGRPSVPPFSLPQARTVQQ